MLLDVTTLFIVSIFVTTILGLFLLFAWVQDRSIRALAWWGVAYLIGGLAVALYTVQDSLSDALTAAFGSALLFVACGVIWSGARLFHGRPVLPFWMFAGAIAWLIALLLPWFADSTPARIGLSSVVISGYTVLTAFELWQGRREPLVSRWPAMVVLGLHAFVFLLPIPIVATVAVDHAYAAFGSWFAVFALETLLYAIATAFIILTMAKERSERIHRTAATIDPLTEVFNRRALLDAGRRVLARMAWDKQPVSVLMFDLDHFKKINDRFGHPVGDRALQTFARTVAANLRATDIVGRLGGEEFAAVLPATNLPSAAVAAERVRAAFEAAGAEIDGVPVKGTVSIGGACAAEPHAEIEAILAQADKALYRAKAGGRNRVALFDAEIDTAPPAGDAAPAPIAAQLAPVDIPHAVAAARAAIKSAA